MHKRDDVAPSKYPIASYRRDSWTVVQNVAICSILSQLFGTSNKFEISFMNQFQS